MVFEEEVFYYELRPDYIVREPIKYGFFNISENYSANDVLGDIQNLIYYTLVYKLNIQPFNFSKYNCVLVIPDIFHRSQIKNIVNMLFKEFQF